MRYQKLGSCGVCAVLVIHWVISSSTFEAAQTVVLKQGENPSLDFVYNVP